MPPTEDQAAPVEAPTTTAPDAAADALDPTAEVGEALRVMLGDEPADEGAETPPEGADEGDAEQPGGEPAETQETASEGDDEADDDDGGGTPRRKEAEPEKMPAWKRAQEARRVAQLKAQREEARALIEAAKKAREEAEQAKAQHEEIARLLTEDPEAAIDRLARMTGRRGQDVIRDLAHRVLKGAPDPKAKETGELAELRQELARMREEAQQTQQRLMREYQEQQQQQFLRANVANLLAVKTDPRAAQAFPTLAALPDARLRHEVESIVSWAASERPDLLGENLPELARTIENAIREEHEAIARSLGMSYDGNRAPEKSAPSRARGGPAAKSAKPSASRHRTQPLTNSGAGAPATGDIPPEQRDAAIGDALRAALSLTE